MTMTHTWSYRDDIETVMLVDDEDGVRRIASLALRRNGFAVIEDAPGSGIEWDEGAVSRFAC